MEATMRRVEAGDLAARAAQPADAAQDEVGRLAGHLDRLLAVIDDNTRSLQRLNADLDAKVAERTAQLEQAQSQLVRNEKLAAVGQLTASIAHEVNNPIAVIQGNLDLMRELLDPAAAAAVRAELRLVDEQIERMRLIVNQLLQFARPGEFAGYVEAVDLPRLLADCLVLVNHLLVRARIEVRRDFTATRCAAVNRQELQQVLVNLMVNAAQAMPHGGTLLLSTRDADAPGADAQPARWVEIGVADTGPGLAPDIRAVLFQPFATGKKEGTGLGLWISRSLVERYGGDITAGDRPGGGACFTLRLPAAAE
jgi:signal transduction histidine kinase